MSYFGLGQLTRGVLDAGKRVRVSEPTSLGDYKLIHGLNSLIEDTAVVGTGSAAYNSARYVALTTAANSDVAVMQTKVFHNYQSGKSQYVEFTFTNFDVESNVIKRAGYFSSSTASPYSATIDGVYLESNGVTGSTVNFVVNNLGTPTATIAQALWDDPMDGTGASGITVDWDKFTIVVIDFLWLGGSMFRLWLFQDGDWHLAHTYKHAGVGTGVAINSPNQPIRYEVRQSGAGSGEFRAICAQVSSEGALDEVAVTRCVSTQTGTANANTAGTFYALVGIRLQSTERDANIRMDRVSLSDTSANKDFYWELRLNPTVNGVFTYSNIANSSTQEAIGDVATNPSSNTVTGGTVIDCGYGNSTITVAVELRNNLRLGSDITGTMDEIVLCVSPMGSGAVNADVGGGITFLEIL